MANCLIGYYTTLSADPGVIQGAYRPDINDPLYIQDLWEAVIPASEEEVFKKNKQALEPSDLLAGSGMVFTHRLANRTSAKKTNPNTRKRWRVHHEEVENIKSDPLIKDIRMGKSEIDKALKMEKTELPHPKRPKKKMRNEDLPRPTAPEKYKMRTGGMMYPGDNLRKKLTSSTMSKREAIKKLLKRRRQ